MVHRLVRMAVGGQGRPSPQRSRLAAVLGAWLVVLTLAAAVEVGAQGDAAAPVRLGDQVVFSVPGEHRGQSARARASRAAEALALVVQESDLPEVRVERTGETRTLVAGDTVILELTVADATASGESSLDTYAATTAARVRQVLGSEHQRSRIAETVLSFSLVVFFALIAFYLIKKVATLAERLRVWLEEHGYRYLKINIKRIELVRPAVLKSTALIVLSVAKWVGQFGIFYAWLVIVLSLFEATRGYTERLTGFVLSPLSQLMGRAFAALPLLVVAAFAAISVLILVRFTGLFLASVARRETSLTWLPSDLAPPASVLLRIAIVALALVFAAPIVTGSDDGSLARTGLILLVALGLAATPLIASALLGALVIFGRRLAVGEYVQVQGKLGRVAELGLLELRLETTDGTEQRIPHLLLLWSAIERFGLSPRLSVEVLVTPDSSPARVLAALTLAGERTGRDTNAEVVAVEAAATRYRVTATLPSLGARSPLLLSALEALSEAGIRAGASSAQTRAD